MKSSSDNWVLDKWWRALSWINALVWSSRRHRPLCLHARVRWCAGLTGSSRWIWRFAGFFLLAVGALFLMTITDVDFIPFGAACQSCPPVLLHKELYSAIRRRWMLAADADGNSRHDRTIPIKPVPLHFITYKWTPSVVRTALRVYIRIYIYIYIYIYKVSLKKRFCAISYVTNQLWCYFSIADSLLL